MLDNDRPEVVAFQELAQLVHHLGDELAMFRRRAIQAEGELKALHAQQGLWDGRRGASVADLEVENAELRQRIDAVTGRARAMLDRVHFLRQQHEQDEKP